jgi:ankyrin repeat protein
MNPIQKEAFLLDLTGLKKRRLTADTLAGTMLAACSAHDADSKKQIAVIRYLKSKGASVLETDKNGVTPLHRAVRFRSPAAVKTLLALNADVNAQDKKSHSTALHRAVTHTGAPRTGGKADAALEIIRRLLQAGADARIKNKLGKKPIDYVKDDEIRKLLG